MSEIAVPPVDAPRRLHLDWVPDAIFRPRQTFARIAGLNTGAWLTPLLVLTITALILVWASGSAKVQAAQSGEMPLPPDYQWYTPEQQAQYQQAMSATSGPVFIYVFPALVALVQVWFGWLLFGGLLHLVLTLLGGRGDTVSALNLVAWSALPLGVRDLVRAVALLSTHSLLKSPGLSGFAPQGAAAWYGFVAALLALVDIYVVWQVVLLIIGTRSATSLPRGRVIGGVLITLLIILAGQALLSFGIGRLGSLTVVRPFF